MMVFVQITIVVLLLSILFTASLHAQSHEKNMSGMIHMHQHSFDPLLSIPERTLFSSMVSKNETEEQHRYFIIQFQGPIDQKDCHLLVEAGIAVFDYIPNNAFIVRMSGSTVNRIQNNKRVRWIGAYAPQFRVASDVIEQVSTTSPKYSSQKPLMLRVTIFPGEHLSDIFKILSTLGTIINKHTTQWKTSVQLKILPANIPALARIQGIQWISLLPKWQLMNNVASRIVNVSQPRDRFSLYGEGQIVAVCDTGLDQGKTSPEALHDDFEDGNGHSRVKSIFNLTPAMFNDEPDDIFSGHGTHVAGTIMGNGYHSGSQPQLDYFPQNASAGIAPKASLVFQAAEDSSTGMLLGLMLDLSQIFAQAQFANARIHSNSWGAASGSTYSTECADVDQFMWDNKDFLIVFAAGNSGVDMDHDGRIDPYSICSPATSKNCLTVGGSESVRSNEGYTCTWGSCWPDLYAKDPIASDNLSDNVDGMAAFSSRGPTLDGRYKPDIVAPATNILSVRSSKASYQGWGVAPNKNYMFMGGTSMATPIVSGTAVLIREYLIKIGIPKPSSALIKAALLNAADTMGSGQYGQLSSQEIPDINPNNVNGWGRLNLGNGVYPESPTSIIYKDEDALETSGTINYYFEVMDAQYPLKINLVWTDYPGSPAAQGGLVNDLDLHIIGPNDQRYYPEGAMNQSTIQTLQYDMNFPIFQTDTNQCAMRFTPESDICFLDAVSIAIANPNDVQDDIWIRVYDQNTFKLRYEKKYRYLPSGWTTLPIDHIEFNANEFIISIEKTSDQIQVSADIFSDSDRGLTQQNGQWVSSNESFYIRAHVRQQSHATDYDRVNNSLGICLNTPKKGVYQVQISGYNVPKGPQPFALVARGSIKESPSQEYLTLSMPESFTEGDGILKEAGIVSIPAPATADLTVYLTSSDFTEIIVQQTIMIPTGQTQARFDIQVVDDPSEDGTQTVIIEARAKSLFPATMTVTVADNDAKPVLVVSPTSFLAPYGEGDVVFTVTNAGNGRMKWYATVDSDWLSIREGDNGINGGNITLHHKKNTDENRLGHLSVHVSDYPNLTQTIPIQQKSEQIETILSPEDGHKYDYFGYATSIWKNTALIGAYKDDLNQTDSGAAYIYKYDGLSWQVAQKIYATDGSRQDYFGCAVSIFDTQIAIGAYNVDDLGNCSGAVYIFEENKNQWIKTAKLLASDGLRNDYFGYSVSISKDQMVAGAYKADSMKKDSGAAYVFEKKGGVWSEKCRILPKKLDQYDYYGYSTAIHEKYIIVGAYGDDDRGSASGAAYIFEKINDQWEEKAKLIPEGIKSNDYCGYSVDISSQYAVLGAYKSDNAGPNAGAVYVFERKNNQWIETAALFPWKSKGYDYFGASVSVSGDYIAVGAYGDSSKGRLSGGGYVFKNIHGSWEKVVHVIPSDGKANDKFGSSVSITDNGETLMGAYGHDARGSQSGIAYIYSVFSVAPVSEKTLDAGLLGSWRTQKQINPTIAINSPTVYKKSQGIFFQNPPPKKSISDNVSSTAIVYTHIPEWGNRIKNLKGIMESPYPEMLVLTIYTYHDHQWQLKAESLPLSKEGHFDVDITKDPGDHLSTNIAVFVLFKTLSVEWPKNIRSFPEKWSEKALMIDIIDRRTKEVNPFTKMNFFISE